SVLSGAGAAATRRNCPHNATAVAPPGIGLVLAHTLLPKRIELVGAWSAQPKCVAPEGQAAVRAGGDGDFGSVPTEFVARVRGLTTVGVTPPHGGVVLTIGAAANGGSCVARHDGRVVFVRYALPGETVRARIIAEKDAYWHAEAVEILEPSPDRIASLCPIAGPGGAGCCDLAFVAPEAARILKGQVVLNQLNRIAGYRREHELRAEPMGTGEATGWRTRVRMKVGFDRRAAYHRYHSSELVPTPDCGQLPAGMLAGVNDRLFPPGAEVHVVVDDDGQRHVVRAGPWEGRRRGFPRTNLEVVEGDRESVQRVGERTWRIPVTGFWQSHRDAARVYSELVGCWAGL